jgi:hypothetical protein
MIKFLKKINRGFFLTLLVVLVVSIYCLSVEMSRAEQGPAITEACEEYLEEYNEWVILPEKYQMKTPGATLSAHVSTLRNPIGKLLDPSNGQLQYELDTLKQNFENQQEYGPFLLSASKKIVSNPIFSFNGDVVSVFLTTTTTYSCTYPGDTKSTENTSMSNDTIVLRKENGEWKVVYSILDYMIY